MCEKGILRHLSFLYFKFLPSSLPPSHLVELGFELMALNLLCRHSTTVASIPALQISNLLVKHEITLMLPES
jgi:hypothetical protein